MQIGSLVKHIEFGYIGIVTKQGVSTCDLWYIHWNDCDHITDLCTDWWYSECELEVLSESR